VVETIDRVGSQGMRRSEILGLRWLDVDLPNRRVLLPQTKNGSLSRIKD
jgi:integrase